MFNNVYGDELISATELNRQPGRILDLALQRPVTITRNEHAFALVPRKDMTTLVEAVQQTSVVVEIINAAYRSSIGEEIGLDCSYAWLKAFNAKELNELVTEVFQAFQLACSTCDWDMLSAVIHEWHESAIAINSPELEAAFNDQDEEVPLTQPTSREISRS